VLIEKQKDDKYHFTIEGGEEVTGKDAALLNKEFNGADQKPDDPEQYRKLMVPEKPVALNEVWKVDAKKFAALVGGIPIDGDKARGTGKLVKTYKKNGRHFGVIEYEFDMPLKGEFGPPGKSFPVQAGSRLVARTKIDICIDGSVTDGSSDSTFDINLTGTIKANDAELKLMIVTKSHEEKSAVELPKENK
jgi:hypothetical protein